MHPKQLETVSALPASERYGYFVRKVADLEELWGLHDDAWAVMADDDGNEVFPFWPEREFAETLAAGSWSSYQAKSISVYDYLDHWIPGMVDDRKCPAVFPTASGKGVVVDPQRLADDLKEEMKQSE